jgi:hypothetical protein
MREKEKVKKIKRKIKKRWKKKKQTYVFRKEIPTIITNTLSNNRPIITNLIGNTHTTPQQHHQHQQSHQTNKELPKYVFGMFFDKVCQNIFFLLGCQ